MNDQQLLEKAKRAHFKYHEEFLRDPDMRRYLERWNPLEDNGEALEVAVTLGMAIHSLGHKVGVVCNGQFEEYFDADPMRATRRAIVRAAAAMGGADGH
ncbi:hypothetical protein DFO67_13412 [Modicisalibacter xianhensis]|uniref:Uncharacterized protein n=1 Tax=Modicisalibacter xianhensis TaxID=442341 RepID=A0A4R8F7U1_9GAMM|nr:hypothetical protein [Halomonas xianhensis]TDX21644.1 hypothetical protein DFO67_13412 [Halomonas xianhensis]